MLRLCFSSSKVTDHPSLVTVTKFSAFAAPAAAIKEIEIINEKNLRICPPSRFAFMSAFLQGLPSRDRVMRVGCPADFPERRFGTTIRRKCR
jgi:hypothetical protein